MSIVYLNGKFIKQEEAYVSAMDRGFLFGDGVYEVILVYSGKMFRGEEHIQRLHRCLSEIKLNLSTENEIDWQNILNNLIEKNGGGNLMIYLQVTRGPAAIRQHAFPAKITPTIFMCTMPYIPPKMENQVKGIKVKTSEDIRWKYCHIKSISLLANVLLFQNALDEGYDETILISDTGYALEASISNLFIVKNKKIITPPKNAQILGGITREFILDLAKHLQIAYEERPISRNELSSADEIWLTSSTKEIRPVIELNEKKVNTGQAGELWHIMITAYKNAIQNFAKTGSYYL